MNIRKIFRKKYRDYEVEPDEIFLDAKNMPNFNRQQFEGRMERSISKNAVKISFAFFLAVVAIFSGKLYALQIEHGRAYYERSEANNLKHDIIFAKRGVIYDRDGKELAWNEIGEEGDLFPRRVFPEAPGFAHLLGYVDYPAQDKAGFFWQQEFIGRAGLEKSYNDVLRGENGMNLTEVNSTQVVQSENLVAPARDGQNLFTSIDSDIQRKLYGIIMDTARAEGYTGGAGAILDVRTGEVLALVSAPEYDPKVMSEREDSALINSYLKDKRNLFLNRVVSGLYTPGSIVKTIVAVAAQNEGIISPEKQILSTGSISVQNPYDKNLKTIFKDWKAHGWVDMRRALAVSSNVYFYEIGGGFEGQKGLGIANIEKYGRLFGLGSETGIDVPGEATGTIPDPEWKEKIFPGDPWRIGDTYHTAIGQYGYQVTLIQMARATASLANDGKLVTPRIVSSAEEPAIVDLGIPAKYFQVVREGMRASVKEGTASAVDVPYVKVGAKAGTAEVGAKNAYKNSWIIGFFPYENPHYAFAVMMERGPVSDPIGAPYVMRALLDWMSRDKKDYFD